MSSPSIAALTICAEFLLLRSDDPLAEEIFMFATNAPPEKIMPQFEPFQWMREYEKKDCLDSAKMVLKVLRYLQIKVKEGKNSFEEAKKKIDTSPLSAAQKIVVFKLYQEKVCGEKSAPAAKTKPANQKQWKQKADRSRSHTPEQKKAPISARSTSTTPKKQIPQKEQQQKEQRSRTPQTWQYKEDASKPTTPTKQVTWAFNQENTEKPPHPKAPAKQSAKREDSSTKDKKLQPQQKQQKQAVKKEEDSWTDDWKAFLGEQSWNEKNLWKQGFRYQPQDRYAAWTYQQPQQNWNKKQPLQDKKQQNAKSRSASAEPRSKTPEKRIRSVTPEKKAQKSWTPVAQKNAAKEVDQKQQPKGKKEDTKKQPTQSKPQMKPQASKEDTKKTEQQAKQAPIKLQPKQQQKQKEKQPAPKFTALPQAQQSPSKSAIAGTSSRSRSEPPSKRQVRFQDEQRTGLINALAWNTEQNNGLLSAVAWNQEQTKGLVSAISWNNYQNRALVNALAWSEGIKSWAMQSTPAEADLKISFKPTEPAEQSGKAGAQKRDDPEKPRPNYQAQVTKQLLDLLDQAEEEKQEKKPMAQQWKPPVPLWTPPQQQTFQPKQQQPNQRPQVATKSPPTLTSVPSYSDTPVREVQYQSESPVSYKMNRTMMLGARAASVPPLEKDTQRVLTPKLEERTPKVSSDRGRQAKTAPASKFLSNNNNYNKSSDNYDNSRWNNTESSVSVGRYSAGSSVGRSPTPGTPSRYGFSIETPEERAVKENTKKNENPGMSPEEPSQFSQQEHATVDWASQWKSAAESKQAPPSPMTRSAPKAETCHPSPSPSVTFNIEEPLVEQVRRQLNNTVENNLNSNCNSLQSSPHISASMPRGTPLVSPNVTPNISASMPRSSPFSTPQTVASMPSHVTSRTVSTVATQKDAPQESQWWNKSKKEAIPEEAPLATHDPKDYEFLNGKWQLKQHEQHYAPAPTQTIDPQPQPKPEQKRRHQEKPQSDGSLWAEKRVGQNWVEETQQEDNGAALAEQHWMEYYNGYQYGYKQGTRQASVGAVPRDMSRVEAWKDLTVNSQFTKHTEPLPSKRSNKGYIQPPPGIQQPLKRAMNLLGQGEKAGNLKEPFQKMVYTPRDIGVDNVTAIRAVDRYLENYANRRISVA